MATCKLTFIFSFNHTEVNSFKYFLQKVGNSLTWDGSVPFCVIYVEENLRVLTRLQTSM